MEEICFKSNCAVLCLVATKGDELYKILSFSRSSFIIRRFLFVRPSYFLMYHLLTYLLTYLPVLFVLAGTQGLNNFTIVEVSIAFKFFTETGWLSYTPRHRVPILVAS
jgi:hypothetical protein